MISGNTAELAAASGFEGDLNIADAMQCKLLRIVTDDIYKGQSHNSDAGFIVQIAYLEQRLYTRYLRHTFPHQNREASFCLLGFTVNYLLVANYYCCHRGRFSFRIKLSLLGALKLAAPFTCAYKLPAEAMRMGYTSDSLPALETAVFSYLKMQSASGFHHRRGSCNMPFSRARAPRTCRSDLAHTHQR